MIYEVLSCKLRTALLSDSGVTTNSWWVKRKKKE